MVAKKLSPKALLMRYRSKRDFTKTSEPLGTAEVALTKGSYLIQKHAARRLHYDFRLEIDGVLKSWAVTRGPSLNPEDKRLAVHVEDHPLDYGSFEGTIPQGQYGGGTVMLWDQGYWKPVGDLEKSYKKGNMTFELHGKRLKGRWHLIRMHGSSSIDKKHDNWLLIKGTDKYANAKGDYALERYMTSVVSDRTMDEIAQGAKLPKNKKDQHQSSSKEKSNKAEKINNKKVGAGHAPPEFIPPQLATLVTEPPTSEGWVHEIKFDGYRLLTRLDNGHVTMNTRSHNDWTKKFGSLSNEILKLEATNALLDGEVVYTNADGTTSFHGLQNALSKGEVDNLHYHIFDLLFLNGVDLRDRPLLERKNLLQKLLKKSPPHIHFSEHFFEPGKKVLTHACHIALEGIISKRADGTYYSGRTESWLKSKCVKEQEIIIGGFTLQPKHSDSLAALLTGHNESGALVFSGKVGTGFSHEEGRSMLKKLRELKAGKMPFTSVPVGSRRGAVWVKPKLVAQVQFAEWTPDGMMRHPSFKGLREDKPAIEVKRETEKPLSQVVSSSSNRVAAKKMPLEVAGVTLSHPDKNLFADEAITKLDLARYYEKVAPLMLPHIIGRPISLMRCPGGSGKACFFQRHGSNELSPYIKPVYVKDSGASEPYLMIEDTRGLIALVQMGVLEIHVWGAKAANLQKPDRLVFDLDPAPDVEFSEVKKSALDIRDRLKKLKLVSFVKTTGGKGLHVVVPFSPTIDWEIAKGFAKGFSQIIAEDDPDHFTINNRKEIRKGKIYIDYLRNGEGASAIAPYSTRAREGAPIALPIEWSELSQLKSAHEFHIKDVIKRIKKDPWQDMLKIKQKLSIK